MQSVITDQAPDSRLRVVYDKAVVTFSVAANATLEDIAWTLGGPAKRRYGTPLAIEVQLTSRNAGPAYGVARTMTQNARSASAGQR